MSKPSEKSSAINIVFIVFVAGSVLFAAFTGRMEEVSTASFESAKAAVTLAIQLIGGMALWLGLVRVLEAGGLMYSLANALKPVMKQLFPDVPATHPAMSAMILNISANMLGLGNAATPFGIKAMMELKKLNPFPGTATNAMCLFLAINTSSVALFPLGVIVVRSAAGCDDPAAIFFPTLIATSASTIVGIALALFLARRDKKYLKEFEKQQDNIQNEDSDYSSDDKEQSTESYEHLCTTPHRSLRHIAQAIISIFLGGLIARAYLAPALSAFILNQLVSNWLLPGLILLIVTYGLARGVKVYEAVTEGAKQGFEIAIRIIPYLVAILVAVGMFRASGAMDALEAVLGAITAYIYMPAEVLPMALVRPLSGSGAFGIMSSIVEYAPNSYAAFVASTMQGSTETTFYVIAVYFGAVGITRLRHALCAALIADLAGIIAACLAARLFWNILGLG